MIRIPDRFSTGSLSAGSEGSDKACAGTGTEGQQRLMAAAMARC